MVDPLFKGVFQVPDLPIALKKVLTFVSNHPSKGGPSTSTSKVLKPCFEQNFEGSFKGRSRFF